MRFGKIFICLFSVLLLLAVMLGAQKEQEPDTFLSVDVPFEGRTENIPCWEPHHDEYFLYLPGSVDIGQMQIRFLGGSAWELDGKPLSDRMPCDQFPMNTPLILTEDEAYVGTVSFYQSSSVGTMFVETASGTMEYIHSKKGNEESGMLRLYLPSGELNHNGPILAMNGRGNSTWNEEKKSYSLELASEADLLGMESAKKWILLSNVYDGTNLHNKIVYDFARDFGLQYSPDCDWVDLYLNGEYAGLYLLSERNEVHPQRVDISTKDSFLVARDAYWRFDEAGKPYITTESNAALRIYHAGMDTEEMLSIWQSAENAILSENGIDPETGKSWQELIDVESWVRKYLVDEVFGNKDGTALSQFYYYDASAGNGKIYAGPVWDYDLSMNLDSDNPQESVQRFYANVPKIYGSLWPNALYCRPEYFSQIVALYSEEFLPLLDTYVTTVIPQYISRIEDSVYMNASRWGFSESVCDAQPIYDFLTLRIRFLNDIWLDASEYCMINATGASGSRSYYAVKPGSLLPNQLRMESSDEGYEYIWYNLQTDERFPVDEPIWEDVEIMVRYEPVSISETTETEIADPIPQTPVPNEEKMPIQIELPSLSRLSPLILLLAVFLAVGTVGVVQIHKSEKPSEKKKE